MRKVLSLISKQKSSTEETKASDTAGLSSAKVESQDTSIVNLDAFVKLMILSHLPDKELVHIARVSCEMRDLSNEPSLWRELSRKNFNSLLDGDGVVDYKKEYGKQVHFFRPFCIKGELPTVKLLFVGESSSRKEAFTTGYIFDPSNLASHLMIGAELATKEFTYNDKYKLKCQLWNTAGQERYKTLTKASVSNTHCAVITIDMENSDGLTSAKHWLTEIQNKTPNSVVAAIGNYKTSSNIRLSPPEIQKFAAENNISLCFTVSTNHDSISKVTNEIIQSTIEHFTNLAHEPSSPKASF